MTQPEDLERLKEQALASIGRNVLHFQRLEAQLKVLALFTDFQSPISQIPATQMKRVESIRMKTMGTLVAELHQRLYGQPVDPDITKAINETHIRFQFTIDADQEHLARQKQALTNLVAERNRLIHQELAEFDPASADSCQQWIVRLDEQNQRILIQLKRAQHLVDLFRQLFQQALAEFATQMRLDLPPSPNNT